MERLCFVNQQHGHAVNATADAMLITCACICMQITCGPVLGKGAFGTTYAGTWRGANVAIKVVRVSDTSELINFLREVQSMCVLKHPNILTFLGAVLCSPTDFWLLTGENLFGAEYHGIVGPKSF